MSVLIAVIFFSLFSVDGTLVDSGVCSDIPKVESMKTFENGQLVSESRYIYNLQGDITQERTVYFDPVNGVQDTLKGMSKKTYTYQKDSFKMTLEHFNPEKNESEKIYTSYFKVNEKGLVTEKYYSFAGKYKFLYKYDGSGYRIYEKFFSYSSDTLYEFLENYNYYAFIYSDSCLMNEVFYSNEPNMDHSIHYTYYTDQINTIGNENFGLGFFGASVKHPVKKKTLSNHNGTYEETFAYEYENGRIVQKTTDTTVIVYTYYQD
ncbi:MAG: hypothetical protein AB9834_24070 [Lentimicrobium sp.]